MDANSVKEDINGAIELIHGKLVQNFGKYSIPFLFGTENQEGINEIISYKDKDVVTPASSGDQYLGAVYYDAKKVDLFDINRLTYFITCLKIAAIIVLDYREFKMFFLPQDSYGRYNQAFWRLNILKRLLPVMPNFVGMFWTAVITETFKVGNWGYFVLPLHENYSQKNIMSGMPFYQSEEEYYKLQAKLRRRNFPNFIECDISDLKSSLSSTYDIVYLSNIIFGLCADRSKANLNDDLFSKLRFLDPSDFRNADTMMYKLKLLVQNDIEKEIIRNILNGVLSHTSETGTILLDYRPNTGMDRKDWLYVNPYFDVNAVASKFDPNYNNGKIEYTDLVLTYKPKKGPVVY